MGIARRSSSAGVAIYKRAETGAARRVIGCAAAACVATISTAAWASDIPYIGVQFYGNNGIALTAGQTAGTVPQANYNLDSGHNTVSISSLTNSSGTATSVNFVSVEGGNYYLTGSGGATPNAALLSGETGDYSGGTATFTFNNVSAGNYNIYVYTATNGPGVETELTLTTGTSTGPTDLFDDEQQGSAFNGTFIGVTDTTYVSSDVGNYVEFTNVSPNGSGTIALTLVNHAVSTGEGVTAIQLAIPAPEPASLALAAVSAIGLLRRRRR